MKSNIDRIINEILNPSYVEEEIKVMNIIQCNGAICVSVNEHYDRYYSEGISKRRKLKINRYKVEE